MPNIKLLSITRLELVSLVKESDEALKVIRGTTNLSVRSEMAAMLYHPFLELKDAALRQIDTLGPETTVVQSFDEIAAELRELM